MSLPARALLLLGFSARQWSAWRESNSNKPPERKCPSDRREHENGRSARVKAAWLQLAAGQQDDDPEEYEGHQGAKEVGNDAPNEKSPDVHWWEERTWKDILAIFAGGRPQSCDSRRTASGRHASAEPTTWPGTGLPVAYPIPAGRDRQLLADKSLRRPQTRW